MISILDRIFLRIRKTPFFWRFTLFTRILLAAGFIPTGMVKLLGHRFTTMTGNPVADFFEAMYQTGAYWQFLGASQVAAGLLLLIPAWAHLGAALFLPIMVNIFVITVAIGFNGTPVVTGLMLLAVLWLCTWDYHRFRPLLTTQPWPTHLTIAQPRLDAGERLGFALFATSLLLFFLGSRDFGLVAQRASLVLGLVAGTFTLLRFLLVSRHRPLG